VDDALKWLARDDMIKGASTIFIKPNLTYPAPLQGVTTTPEFLDALVRILRDRTAARIFIGESDGGYHSYKAQEAFRGHGLYELGKRYGVEIINLSSIPSERAISRVGCKEIAVELPSFLLREVDFFITAPVPKIHAMTGVSLGLKNQWGCLPDTMRLYQHFQFSEKIVAINKLLRPRLVLFDGTYFLDVNGPIAGKPVHMNMIIASDDIGAGDHIVCRLMGIDPGRIRYLKAARREGLFPAPKEEIETNQPVDNFRTHQFCLKRSMVNRIALIGFRSSFGTKLLYDSVIGDLLHKVLGAFKKNGFLKSILYGKCIY
jgi:uncharacterized protein (DUF362 family)